MAAHESLHPDQFGTKHPRLQKAMEWQGILSRSESASAVSGMERGDPYGGGEAVWHYGGAQKLAADAFRNRNRMPAGTWRSS